MVVNVQMGLFFPTRAGFLNIYSQPSPVKAGDYQNKDSLARGMFTKAYRNRQCHCRVGLLTASLYFVWNNLNPLNQHRKGLSTLEIPFLKPASTKSNQQLDPTQQSIVPL